MDLEKIKTYLVDNREHIENLLKPYKKEKEQLLLKHESIMKPLIEDEFNFVCRRVISNDLAVNGRFNPKEALYASEILDLQHYLQSDIIDIIK